MSRFSRFGVYEIRNQASRLPRLRITCCYSVLTLHVYCCVPYAWANWPTISCLMTRGRKTRACSKQRFASSVACLTLCGHGHATWQDATNKISGVQGTVDLVHPTLSPGGAERLSTLRHLRVAKRASRLQEVAMKRTETQGFVRIQLTADLSTRD